MAVCGVYVGIRQQLADCTSSRMALESGLWKNERIANVGYLEPIQRGCPRPEAEVHVEYSNCRLFDDFVEKLQQGLGCPPS